MSMDVHETPGGIKLASWQAASSATEADCKIACVGSGRLGTSDSWRICLHTPPEMYGSLDRDS